MNTKERLEAAEGGLPQGDGSEERDKLDQAFLKERGLDFRDVREYCSEGGKVMFSEMMLAMTEEHDLTMMIQSGLAAAIDSGICIGLLLADQKEKKKK